MIKITVKRDKNKTTKQYFYWTNYDDKTIDNEWFTMDKKKFKVFYEDWRNGVNSRLSINYSPEISPRVYKIFENGLFSHYMFSGDFSRCLKYKQNFMNIWTTEVKLIIIHKALTKRKRFS